MLTYCGHHVHATWCTCCFLAFDQLSNQALFWAISDWFVELQVVKSRGLNSVDNWHDRFTTRRKLTKELQHASIEEKTKNLGLAFPVKFSKNARTQTDEWRLGCIEKKKNSLLFSYSPLSLSLSSVQQIQLQRRDHEKWMSVFLSHFFLFPSLLSPSLQSDHA